MNSVSVWSRSRLFLPGAGADPIWSEPESAPGPRTSGAAQKSGGSATLEERRDWPHLEDVSVQIPAGLPSLGLVLQMDKPEGT